MKKSKKTPVKSGIQLLIVLCESANRYNREKNDSLNAAFRQMKRVLHNDI